MTPALSRNGHPTAVLDSHEAAAYLAVSEASLYRLVRSGEVPHTRVGKSLRFRIAELDAYLEARTSREWTRAPGDGRGRPSNVDNGRNRNVTDLDSGNETP